MKATTQQISELLQNETFVGIEKHLEGGISGLGLNEMVDTVKKIKETLKSE